MVECLHSPGVFYIVGSIFVGRFYVFLFNWNL